MVSALYISAQLLMFCKAGPMVLTTSIVLAGDGCPIAGNNCSKIMMTPIPLMKPEMTGYGMYLMRLPILKIPITTWKIPASTKHAIMGPIAVCISPVVAIKVAMVAALTTVMGPVGPLICEGVPPNAAAKNPRKMAPYNPAAAPNPDCTPKANASGNATIPAVKPPKKSPLVNLKFLSMPCIT